MPRRAREFADPTPGPRQRAPIDERMLLRARARLMLAQHRALAMYGANGDPWAFVRDCVWTRDEASLRTRKYPDRDYARFLVGEWQQYPLLAVPKSRRMVVTWLFVGVAYWLARFHPYAKIACMARKLGKTESEGSAELVKRAKFIHEQLDARVPLFPKCDVEYSIGSLRFENGSEILGLGEGPEQARQHTFTYVLADEVAFWEQSYETWIALKPTIEGGGRITAVSSANPGFFRDLVHDTLG